jgi:hypothetical protein
MAFDSRSRLQPDAPDKSRDRGGRIDSLAKTRDDRGRLGGRVLSWEIRGYFSLFHIVRQSEPTMVSIMIQDSRSGGKRRLTTGDSTRVILHGKRILRMSSFSCHVIAVVSYEITCAARCQGGVRIQRMSR